MPRRPSLRTLLFLTLVSEVLLSGGGKNPITGVTSPLGDDGAPGNTGAALLLSGRRKPIASSFSATRTVYGEFRKVMPSRWQ